jgi:SAM-dependent methyltransferase
MPVQRHKTQKSTMIKGGRAEKIFSERLASLLSVSNRILDVGTSQRFAKELRPYESWFDGKTYLAAGYEPSLNYGVYNCDLHADIEDLPFLEHQFDAIICLEVLEHVRQPQKAADELLRVLKPGGILLLTTPFLLGYHGKSKQGDQTYSHTHSAYPDFWRFTHEGLLYMFSGFAKTELDVLNGPVETGLTVFNLARWFSNPVLRKLVDCLDRPRLGAQTTRHLVYATK